MAEGLVIPISTPGGEESATALGRVADKLEQVGGAADASATKMNTSATASSAALGRIVAAVEQTGKSTEEAGNRAEASGQKWENFWSGGVRGAARFVVVHQALVTVADAVASATRHIGALVDEQERLTAMSNRLGLNFDDAAAAAGRFVDETAAMGVASRFAAADIRLTQQELNDIMRVAGATAQTLGTDLAGEAQQLTEALIRGREGGLQRYGGAMVESAGHAHTLASRFVDLHKRAGEVSQATDNAATRMERFVDSLEDAQRVATTAFVQEIMRLDDVGRGLRERTSDAQEFERSLQAAGQTAAAMATRAGAGIAILGGVIGTVIGGLGDMLRVAAAARNGVGAAQAEFARLANSGWSAQSINLITDSVRRLEALDAADEQRTSMDPRDVPAAAARPTDEETRADRTERTRREGGGGRGAGGDNSALARQQRDAINAAFGAANDNARISDLEDLAGLAHDRAAAVHEAELQGLLWSEQTRQDREQMEVDAERVAAEHTLRNKADLESRLTDQEQFAEAEKSVLASRLAAHETYAGRMRELQGEQASAAARAAEFTNAAFQSTGKALGSHIQALATGKESVGAALEGMLADTLTSIGQEAMVKGAFETAQGLSALAGVVTAPLAPGHFAAAGAYFGVGALALAGGAAISASSAATPSASAGGGAGRAGDVTPSGTAATQGAAPMIQHIYYAPVIGERESTDAEVDIRLNRYRNAGRARRRRAA